MAEPWRLASFGNSVEQIAALIKQHGFEQEVKDILSKSTRKPAFNPANEAINIDRRQIGAPDLPQEQGQIDPQAAIRALLPHLNNPLALQTIQQIKALQPQYKVQEGAQGQFYQYDPTDPRSSMTQLTEPVQTNSDWTLSKGSPDYSPTRKNQAGGWEQLYEKRGTRGIEYKYAPMNEPPSNGSANIPASADDIETAAKAVAAYDADLATLPRQDKTKILARARQINPKFNQINYNANKALKTSYTSGKQSQNIVSLNTALGHLADLRSAGDALKNGDIQLLNSIAVQYGRQTGQSAPDVYETVRDAVANELATTFKGSSGTDIGLQGMLRTMQSKQSPQQIEGVIKSNVKLLKSRLDALNSNYKKQTGVDFPVLDEEKRPFVDQMLGNVSGGEDHPSDQEIDSMTPDQLKNYLAGKPWRTTKK